MKWLGHTAELGKNYLANLAVRHSSILIIQNLDNLDVIVQV